MNGETLYAFFGIISLVVIGYVVLSKTKKTVAVKSKEQKREEILQDYKVKLRNALKSFQNNEQRRERKNTLLKEFSDELALNIFFDADEKKEIIMELAKE